MADERTVTDTEKDDSDDTSWNGIIARLDRITGILQKANARLDRLDPVLQNPPDPIKPQLRTSLASLQTEAQNILDDVNRLITRA
ncbi:MAG: hypothetical protein HOW73_32305 [Polyangiaceae bacterium]|nr:hypothetical protein [Polyangiaceae bacterium]